MLLRLAYIETTLFHLLRKTQTDGILGEDRTDLIDRKFKMIFDRSYTTLSTFSNEGLQRRISMALIDSKYDPVLSAGKTTITITPTQTPDNHFPSDAS